MKKVNKNKLFVQKETALRVG